MQTNFPSSLYVIIIIPVIIPFQSTHHINMHFCFLEEVLHLNLKSAVNLSKYICNDAHDTSFVPSNGCPGEDLYFTKRFAIDEQLLF